jgi:hypothetical protein
VTFRYARAALASLVAHLDELERRQARRHISAREFDSVHLGTGMEG